MNKNILGLIIVILLITAGVWFYSKGTKSGYIKNESSSVQIGMPVPGSNVPENIVNPAGESGAVKEFTVIGANFSFTPSSITVNKGDKVKITLKNSGGFHDLLIEGYDVGTPKIQAGAESSFEFVADKAGTFEYYCSVGNHRAEGMRGTFTVK